MAALGRLVSVFRNAVRSPRSLRAVARHRAVGPAIVGSALGTGLICYYQYLPNRTLLFAVHAEAPKVSSRLIKVNQSLTKVCVVEQTHLSCVCLVEY